MEQILDGGAIQDSTYRALSGGIKTDDIFEIIEDFKKIMRQM